MKVTQQDLDAAIKLSKDHPCVSVLLEHYKFITSNPVYEGYVARRITLDKWNEDLIKNPVPLIVKKQSATDQEQTDKDVERVQRYLKDQLALSDATQAFLERLSPEEQAAINQDKRLKESVDRPFKAATTTGK